jgi:DNA-binding Lrp family transcriptional regulator
MRKIESVDDLDQFDRRILEVLSEDGRIPVTELSKKGRSFQDAMSGATEKTCR